MRESDIAIGFGCGFVGVIGHDPSWSHGVGWGWALCDRPSDGGGGRLACGFEPVTDSPRLETTGGGAIRHIMFKVCI